MMYTLTPQQAQISIKIDKPSYYPGEIIKGVVYMKIKTKDIQAGLLYLKLCGQEKVNQLDSYNQFFSYKQFIYKKQKKIADFGIKMPIIACKKYFELEVPSLYPSFTVNYYKLVQCRILYFLSVSIQSEDEKNLYKVPKKHRVVVHILQKLPIQNVIPIEYSEVSKNDKRCCFSTGNTKVKIQLNKAQYVFGDSIQLNISVDNSQSNVAVQKFELKISSQLVVLYRQQKRKLSNYFDIYLQELNEQIQAHSQKQIATKIHLPTGKPDNYTSIFPQSTIKTKRVSYQYILTVNVIFSRQLFFKVENLVASIPLILIQHQKREKNNIIQSMDNLSMLGSILETNQKLNTSQLKKFIYGDHNSAGYGEQDGYVGPERKYNPIESLDEFALKDTKGALEQLMFKKQYEEDSDIDEEFENEIDGISMNDISINQIQSSQDQQQKQRTIFNQKQQNEFNCPNSEEFKQVEGIQEHLQTIKEEQESKGTQYNLNNIQPSFQVQKNPQKAQKDSHQIQTFGSVNSGLDNYNYEDVKSPNEQTNPRKSTILKKNKNTEQNDQREQKQLKVQFVDITSVDTLDGKNGDKMTTQKQKR
ncbi:unnamed protein product (macronuclear) [Paramecium tetraurelia]|uniref:Arrestin C-terminal-like domain-containing protein n=1 Tax=Paramecium tetraurelia TaxID=5888 RepID=A0CWE9_PARTE|nr:uncharacterized protein GSPATT00001318001 [Paramecium tetraurelia]CAK75116.1 unnamed protein product [Paramecium tetraurelia]|eukprot:XP_001442513.1 hypothetical protein (macronuclear) [Paramecium tetraurelia strain d4-2]